MSSAKTWFISDLHFNHKSVIHFGKRPYRDVKDMNRALIKNWNSVVSPRDTVYVVGDVFYGKTSPEEARRIITSLNGKKILISGNHDPDPGFMIRAGFDQVAEEIRLKYKSIRLRLCHYPYRSSLFYYLYFEARYLFFKKLGKLQGKKYWRVPFWRYMRKPSRHLLRDEILVHGHTHSSRILKGDMINVCVEAVGQKPIPLEKVLNLAFKARDSYPKYKKFLLKLFKIK